MHTIRRRFKSSNVRWFKIMKATKQLHVFYQTALILCSELENTLYYTCTSSIAHEQYLFSQVFFASYPNTFNRFTDNKIKRPNLVQIM